jgi:hypothetical protein
MFMVRFSMHTGLKKLEKYIQKHKDQHDTKPENRKA